MRLRPWVAGTLAAVALIVTAGYIGSAAYLVIRDDALTASLDRQSTIRNAYEDRLADMRGEIDRLRSRTIVQKRTYEHELTRLAERQAELDARQDVIAGLSHAARGAGIVLPKPRPDRAALRTSLEDPAREAAIDADALHRAAEQLSERQEEYVSRVAAALDGRRTTLYQALTRIDMTPDGVESAGSGVGGPFVPAGTEPGSAEFQTVAAALIDDIEVYRRMADLAASAPLARPVETGKLSSRFGRRKDPFTRRPAHHAGLDFRAKSGTHVRATAPGKVISAKRNGGYGNQVVVDHGNGMTTRYAHLSRISVKRGQQVAAGDLVGKVGSTGRSTGPHLHYEIRRDGRAVDPAPFLDVGAEIGELIAR